MSEWGESGDSEVVVVVVVVVQDGRVRVGSAGAESVSQ